MAKLRSQVKRPKAKGTSAPPPHHPRHSSINSTEADTLAEQQLLELLTNPSNDHDNGSNRNDGNTRDTISSPETRAGKQRGAKNINKSSHVAEQLDSPRVSIKATQRAPPTVSPSSSAANAASSSSSSCLVKNTTPVSSPQEKRKTEDDTVVVPGSEDDDQQPPPTLPRRPRYSRAYSEDSMMDNNPEKSPAAAVHPAPGSINKRRVSPPYKVAKPASKSRKSSPVLSTGKESRFTEGSMGDRTSKVPPLEYLEEDDELRTVREFQKQKQKKKKKKDKDKDKNKARDKDGAVGFGRKTWERMSSPIKDNHEVDTGEEMPSAKEKSTMGRLGKFVTGSWKQPFGGVKEVKEIQTREKSRSVSPVKEDKMVEKKSRKTKQQKHGKSVSHGDNGVDNREEEQLSASNGSKDTRKRGKSNSISPVKGEKAAEAGNRELHHKRYEKLMSHEDDKAGNGTTERQARISASESNLRGLPREAATPCVVIPTGPSKTPAPEKRSGLGFRMLTKSATKSAMALHSKGDKSGVNNKEEDERKKKLLKELKNADTERERIVKELSKLDGEYTPSDLNIGTNSLPGTPSEKFNRGVGKQGNGEKRLPRPPSVSRAGTPFPDNPRSVRRTKSTVMQNSDSRKRKALISADIDDDDLYDLKVRQYDNDDDGDYVDKIAPNDGTPPRRQPKRMAKQVKRVVPLTSGLIEPPYIAPRGSSRGRHYGPADVVTITPGSKGYEDIPPVPELPSKPSKAVRKKRERERREKEGNPDSDDDGDDGEVKWPSDCF